MTTDLDSLLVVGSLAFDDLDLPSGSFRDQPGGTALYASTAASLLVGHGVARVVGVVGSDFPESLVTKLGSRGVDTSGIERVDGRTFRWHGRYADDLASRTTLDTQLNVFATFSPKIGSVHRGAAFVFLGNIHPALQGQVLDQVHRPKFVAADTMN